MKNRLCLGMVAASVAMTVSSLVLFCKNAALRSEMSQKEKEWRLMLSEKFRVSWHVGGYAEDLMFVHSCNDILNSVSNRQCVALGEYAEVLSRLCCFPRIGNCADAENALRKTFLDSFLWRGEQLKDFEGPAALEIFLRVNLDLMIHYGNLDIRNGDLEAVPAKEYLALKTLNDYKRKFQREEKREFVSVVDSFLKLLIDRIESSDGFTRVGAHYMVQLNTDMANAMKHGMGVSHESGMRIGRAIAQGLVRCGYTPKWLDKDFPLPK